MPQAPKPPHPVPLMPASLPTLLPPQQSHPPLLESLLPQHPQQFAPSLLHPLLLRYMRGMLRLLGAHS
jgi:hypothetical protein